MKRILSFLVILTMVLTFVQLPTLAADGTGYYEAETDVFVVTTEDGLTEYIADNTYVKANHTVYLECDVTLNAKISACYGALIGRKNGVEGAPVTVTLATTMFDSIQDKAIISNLILRPAEVSNFAFTISYQGVLANQIKNIKKVEEDFVKISNVESYVSASINNLGLGMVGRLADNIEGTLEEPALVFENCVNRGDFSSTYYNKNEYSHVGGIVGNNTKPTVQGVWFVDCKNYGTITGQGVSGIFGGMYGTPAESLDFKFSGCANYGDIVSTGQAAGIFAGDDYKPFGGIVIENCTNEGDITAASYAGGIYAYCETAGWTVTGCRNTGNITASTNTGGIAGNLKDGIISSCINEGDVTGNKYIGGIIGIDNSTTGSSISDCVNKGDIICVVEDSVSYSGYYAGGIAGGITTTPVTKVYNFGKVSGVKSLGGLIGKVENDGSNGLTSISKSANYGEVVGTGNNIGGIVGYPEACAVSETFNAGAITAAKYAGGFFGTQNNAAYGYNQSIVDCYNVGTITATDATGNATGIAYSLGHRPTEKPLTHTIKNVYNAGAVNAVEGGSGKAYNVVAMAGIGAGCSYDIGNIYYDTTAGGYEEYIGVCATDSTLEAGYTFERVFYNEFATKDEAGFERLPEGFSPDIWVACEGSYPILKNNLPKNADGSDKEYAVVTLSNGENGEALKDAVTYVEKGGSYTVTLTPVTGYVVDTVTADGEVVEGAVNTYVVENVSDDIEVVVSYTTAPASEGVTNANRLFVATDDAYSLYAFGKYNVVEGNEAVDFGILVSFEAIDTEDFVITNEDVRKFSACIGEAAMGATEDGEYGVKLFGTMITEDGVYYCLPYAQYADGTVCYGTVMTVVND